MTGSLLWPVLMTDRLFKLVFPDSSWSLFNLLIAVIKAITEDWMNNQMARTGTWMMLVAFMFLGIPVLGSPSCPALQKLGELCSLFSYGGVIMWAQLIILLAFGDQLDL